MMLVRRAFLADAAGIAAVHVDCWESTYAGVLPAGYLAARLAFWTDVLTERPGRLCFCSLPGGWFGLRICVGRTGTVGRGVVFGVFVGGSAGAGFGTAVGGGGVGDTWRPGRGMGVGGESGTGGLRTLGGKAPGGKAGCDGRRDVYGGRLRSWTVLTRRSFELGLFSGGFAGG